MPIDVKQYYEGLLKDAGVAQDKLQVFMEVLTSDSVSKKVADDLIAPRMRHDEFSRKMDEVTAKDKRNEEWYAKEVAKYNEVTELESQLKAKLAGTGDDTNDGGKNLISTPTDMLTRKEFEEKMSTFQSQNISVMKQVGEISSDYGIRFGKKPDFDAIEKIVVEKGLPLRQAYQEYIRPEIEAKQAADYEAKIKAAREEGAREFASTHQIPIDTKPKEQHLIFDKPATDLPPAGPMRERALRNSFVEAWNTNETEATSGATK